MDRGGTVIHGERRSSPPGHGSGANGCAGPRGGCSMLARRSWARDACGRRGRRRAVWAPSASWPHSVSSPSRAPLRVLGVPAGRRLCVVRIAGSGWPSLLYPRTGWMSPGKDATLHAICIPTGCVRGTTRKFLIGLWMICSCEFRRNPSMHPIACGRSDDEAGRRAIQNTVATSGPPGKELYRIQGIVIVPAGERDGERPYVMK